MPFYPPLCRETIQDLFPPEVLVLQHKYIFHYFAAGRERRKTYFPFLNLKSLIFNLKSQSPDGRTKRSEIVRGTISARGQTAAVDRHPEILEERYCQNIVYWRDKLSLYALARMAELVDALVSNTSSFLECRFDPGSGYRKALKLFQRFF